MREWLGLALLPMEDEASAYFSQRRWSHWQEMIASEAWGDFVTMVVKSRDGVIRDLIAATPNKYHERGDNEKRAMIHAMNVILELPVKVEDDAKRAAEATRRHQEQMAR